MPLLEFDARKILQRFFVSTYRPITHIKALITVTVAGCCKKNFDHIRFADLTPDGFHVFHVIHFGTGAPRDHARCPGAEFWRRHCSLAFASEGPCLMAGGTLKTEFPHLRFFTLTTSSEFQTAGAEHRKARFAMSSSWKVDTAS